MLNRCSGMLKHVRFLCSSMSVSDARPMLNECSENAPNSTNMLRAMQAECLARATDGRTDGLTNMLGAPPEEISLPGNPRGGARPHTPGPPPESTHTHRTAGASAERTPKDTRTGSVREHRASSARLDAAPSGMADGSSARRCDRLVSTETSERASIGTRGPGGDPDAPTGRLAPVNPDASTEP